MQRFISSIHPMFISRYDSISTQLDMPLWLEMFSCLSGSEFPCLSGAEFPCLSGAEFPCPSSSEFPCLSSTEFPCLSGAEFPCLSGAEFPCLSGSDDGILDPNYCPPANGCEDDEEPVGSSLPVGAARDEALTWHHHGRLQACSL
ncbi:hypothetical protein FHG87_002112 [Trinorchestia longiramus]|nr:hypothetical protein FHG87_002112 [Trinorchestia longiramus]